jgi:hypothetical protein
MLMSVVACTTRTSTCVTQPIDPVAAKDAVRDSFKLYRPGWIARSLNPERAAALEVRDEKIAKDITQKTTCNIVGMPSQLSIYHSEVMQPPSVEFMEEYWAFLKESVPYYTPIKGPTDIFMVDDASLGPSHTVIEDVQNPSKGASILLNYGDGDLDELNIEPFAVEDSQLTMAGADDMITKAQNHFEAETQSNRYGASVYILEKNPNITYSEYLVLMPKELPLGPDKTMIINPLMESKFQKLKKIVQKNIANNNNQ